LRFGIFFSFVGLWLVGFGWGLTSADSAADFEWGEATAFDPEFTSVIVVGIAACDFAGIAFVENERTVIWFGDVALGCETVKVPELVRDAPYPEVLVYREADGRNLVGCRAVFWAGVDDCGGLFHGDLSSSQGVTSAAGFN
jgi:hypothetical protein